MPRLSLDAELDRLLAESQDEARFTELSIVLRRLLISPQVPPKTKLFDDAGNEWLAGDERDHVQPVACPKSRQALPGTRLRWAGGETFLIAHEVLRAGGVWDNITRDWKREPDGERCRAENPVIIDLQESQLDAAVWFAERLKAFRERKQHQHCVGLLLDDRRGGKSFICNVFVTCVAVDVPRVDGQPTEIWVVTQSIPARDELDEYTKAVIRLDWARYRELPKRMWTYRHGSKVHMKTTDDPESLRVGRVDLAFFNEAALLPESGYEIALRATQDKGGFMLLASNRPKRAKGRWVVRLWEGSERDAREGQQPSVKLLKVPPALNTAIDHSAKAGIARAIMYTRDDDDESDLDEGLVLEAGRKLLAPPWDDNQHLRPLPAVGVIDVTADVIRRVYGVRPGVGEYQYIAGADFQNQCACAVFKLLAQPSKPEEFAMWCVGAIFLTDKDNGDEDSLCDAILSLGITQSQVLLIGDSSGMFQNGRHDQGLVSFIKIQKRGFEITAPTRKKGATGLYPKNPDVEASLMRFRKWIAGGRFYISTAPEAGKMAMAMKRCDAYLDKYNNLRPRGKWAHLVDCARYPQWWLSEKLAGVSGEVPNYVKGAGQVRR
jgi:hypothetical protein